MDIVLMIIMRLTIFCSQPLANITDLLIGNVFFLQSFHVEKLVNVMCNVVPRVMLVEYKPKMVLYALACFVILWFIRLTMVMCIA